MWVDQRLRPFSGLPGLGCSAAPRVKSARAHPMASGVIPIISRGTRTPEDES